MTETPSTVDPAVITEAAAWLRRADETRTPIPPVRTLIGADDIDAAYAVQRVNIEQRLAQGRTVVGRKIGLTSEAVQAQLGVDRPDFGVLLDDMAYSDGDLIAHDAVLQPKAEAEVAFVLARDLADGELDHAQVSAAIGHAVAAIEVCGSRVADWDITFGDTVADNASAGVYVLGSERRTLDEVTPRDVAMSMTINGDEVSTGTGAACLGDPLEAVVWLARTARDLGEPLRAGQVVLSGALGPMRPVAPGDEVVVTITGLGSVSATFSKEQA
ncbi:2-keto-4-pentenoate hydratase [Aeromicrobium sp. 179-A 4D2 NHS]|uniref:2-keto-4-pentenoate hydratase n=1 Tax=Aeromicrobium sp. 179-A 4D2 NHS TaxID=3142375 RepID=UPI0039A10B9E